MRSLGLIAIALTITASPIFRTLVRRAMVLGLSAWWWCQYTAQDFLGRGEAEVPEDLFLAFGRAGGMDHVADPRSLDVQAVDLKDAQHPFRGHPLLVLSFLVQDFLAIESFQHLVGLQRDFQ